jgi:hypothetical protein
MTSQLQPLPSTVAASSEVQAILAASYGTRYDPVGEVLTSTDVLRLARQCGSLLGPAYSAPDGSTNASDLLSFGAILALQRAFGIANLGEAFSNSTTDLLSEWERMLGLPDGSLIATDDARRTALLARWRTRFAGTPNAMITALTPLNGGAPIIRESVASESRANARRVFAFTFKVTIDPNDAPAIAPLAATIGVMKPAHTREQFTNMQMSGFFCNSASSLTNNTVL